MSPVTLGTYVAAEMGGAAVAAAVVGVVHGGK